MKTERFELANPRRIFGGPRRVEDWITKCPSWHAFQLVSVLVHRALHKVHAVQVDPYDDAKGEPDRGGL